MEAPQDEGYDQDDEAPALAIAEEGESSDDEMYIDEEIEDIELVYVDSEDSDDEQDPTTQPEGLQGTRSGRRVRPPMRYRNTININRWDAFYSRTNALLRGGHRPGYTNTGVSRRNKGVGSDNDSA